MAYYIDASVGDSIRIGEVLVSIEQKNGRKARLGIDAERSIPVELIKKEIDDKRYTGKP